MDRHLVDQAAEEPPVRHAVGTDVELRGLVELAAGRQLVAADLGAVDVGANKAGARLEADRGVSPRVHDVIVGQLVADTRVGAHIDDVDIELRGGDFRQRCFAQAERGSEEG